MGPVREGAVQLRVASLPPGTSRRLVGMAHLVWPQLPRRRLPWRWLKRELTWEGTYRGPQGLHRKGTLIVVQLLRLAATRAALHRSHS